MAFLVGLDFFGGGCLSADETVSSKTPLFMNIATSVVQFRKGWQMNIAGC